MASYQLEYQRRRRRNVEERKKDSEAAVRYYWKNRREVLRKGNIRRQARYKSDPAFRLKECMRARVRIALVNLPKSGKTFELVGCSPQSLKAHLESLFKPGMTWENYGQWQVDHKTPCASFDLMDPEQQRQCFHFSNLQPLWAIENLTKGSKTGTV